jgi:hypothetical protein
VSEDKAVEMSVIARWECKSCGAAEGDVHSVECTLRTRMTRVSRAFCREVEYVPAEQLQGAVSKDRADALRGALLAISSGHPDPERAARLALEADHTAAGGQS